MEVITIYDEFLRNKLPEVTVFDNRLKREAEEMLSLMHKEAGIGLSGNQVRLNKRIIVAEYNPTKEDKLPRIPKMILVNPKIESFSRQRDVMNEGCLSLPGLELPVERSSGISLSAQDVTGRKMKLRLKGLSARVVQHEIDHLDGILFTDRVGKKDLLDLNQFKFAKIVFAGSDEFSLEALKTLIDNKLNVIGVITESDKEAGRGRRLTSNAVKKFAKENNLNVFEPTGKAEINNIITSLKPHLVILSSYGKIIPKEALKVPSYGWLNLHPSLLPKYRGATPIQSTLLAGDHETGVTLMVMDEGVDTGKIVDQKRIIVSPKDSFLSLREKLAVISAEILIKSLPSYLAGQSKLISQDASRASQTHRLKKEDGLIDWRNSAENIERQIRALNPWPGSYTFLDGSMLKFLEASLTKGKLTPKTVQLSGKKPSDWLDFMRGYREKLKKEDWFSKIS